MIFVAWTIRDVKLFSALSARSQVASTVIALRLSSYLYARYRGLHAVGLWQIPIISSCFFWQKGNLETEIDKRFYRGLNISDSYFKRAFLNYQKKLHKHFSGITDTVLLTGTARVSEQAVRQFFRRSDIIYWEAGCIGTIYMSRGGVNADADFRDASHGERSPFAAMFAQLCSIDRKCPIENFRTAEFCFKVLDGVVLVISRYLLANREIDELLNFNLNLLSKARIRNKGISDSKRSPYILYIDQVEQDTNCTHFGCAPADVVNRIGVLLDSIDGGSGVSLVRRAHPRQPSTAIGTALKRCFSGIFVDSMSGDIGDAISGAQCVVTVNSTAGIDSLLLGKPVCVLGSSYFDNLYGVMSVEQAIEFTSGRLCLDEIGMKKSVRNFLGDNFIPIDFRSGEFFAVDGFDEFMISIRKSAA